MSKKNPECPVAISKNCPDFRNKRVCALVRSDKKCFRKFGASRPRIQVNSLGPVHQPYDPTTIKNVTTPGKRGFRRTFPYRKPI